MLYDQNGDEAYPDYTYIQYNVDQKKFGDTYIYSLGKYDCVYFSKSYLSSGGTAWPVMSKSGMFVKVWKTKTDLRNYLCGNSSTKNIYTTTNYTKYDVNNDNSITVSNETVQNILNNNYQTAYNNAYNSIRSDVNNYYYENNSVMSESQIQAIIEKTMNNLMQQYPSGGGEEPTEPETPTESETETETGGDISGNTPGGSVSGNGVDGPKTVGLLQKILDKISEFFVYVKTEIYDMLKSIRNAIRLDAVAGVVETVADIIANRLDDLGGFVGEIASDFEAP